MLNGARGVGVSGALSPDRSDAGPRAEFSRVSTSRAGFRCAYCGRGKPENVKLHIDYIVPVARGGTTELENFVTACARCNVGK
jgi:5-methylcytosine-specific restriction endonuclease McrA